MVGPGDARVRQHGTHDRPQAALQPVADDRVTNLFGDGETGTNTRVVAPPPDQEDEPWRRRPPPGIGRDEIAAQAENGVAAG